MTLEDILLDTSPLIEFRGDRLVEFWRLFPAVDSEPVWMQRVRDNATEVVGILPSQYMDSVQRYWLGEALGRTWWYA